MRTIRERNNTTRDNRRAFRLAYKWASGQDKAYTEGDLTVKPRSGATLGDVIISRTCPVREVKGQCLVTSAPVIANAPVTLDDKGGYPKCLEASSHHQPTFGDKRSLLPELLNTYL